MLLAKFAAVAVLVWFYQTAKDNDESPAKWAIIGLIGFGITWEMAHLITDAMTENRLFSASIPAIVGAAATWFIRQKLLLDAKRDNA
jgi:putative flippase GtrA